LLAAARLDAVLLPVLVVLPRAVVLRAGVPRLVLPFLAALLPTALLPAAVLLAALRVVPPLAARLPVARLLPGVGLPVVSAMSLCPSLRTYPGGTGVMTAQRAGAGHLDQP